MVIYPSRKTKDLALRILETVLYELCSGKNLLGKSRNMTTSDPNTVREPGSQRGLHFSFLETIERSADFRALYCRANNNLTSLFREPLFSTCNVET